MRYEEYDLRGLQEDPSLDPADPEVLYAMARCFRLGKGVEPDEAAALELLRAAEKAGSEAARAELAARTPAPVSAGPLPDYGAMSDDELMQREEGELGADLERFRRHWAEEECIARCAEAAVTQWQRWPVGLRRKALEKAGAFYWEQDPAKSRRLYELARELGSTAACGPLLKCYDQGIGGGEDPELAKDCVRRMELEGTAEDLYHCAAWRTKRNGGTPDGLVRRDLARAAELMAERRKEGSGQ